MQSIEGCTPGSLDAFLTKLLGKNLGGYSTEPAVRRALTVKDSNTINQDQSTYDETADGK